jgi:DNA-binding transcriptional LysR family regulator
MQSGDYLARRMKLLDLHILMAVAQAGSMNKAAVALNMSQPAISRSIAELEHAVGVRLLDRNARGVEPNAYGRALLDGGTAVFDDLRQAVKNIEFLADPTAGEVRIGSNPPVAASFVTAVIDRLSRRHPRIAFHLVTTETERLHRELSERNVDLVAGQRFGPLADEQLGFEKLYDEPFVVVASAQNPWARRRRIKLAELMNELWALPPLESALGSLFMEAFRASGLNYPRAIVYVFAHEARISLLETGRFLSIFSKSRLTLPTERPQLKVLPVEAPLPSRPVGLLYLKNRTLSPATQLFFHHAREVAKPLVRKMR